jgi:hypothetical protein
VLLNRLGHRQLAAVLVNRLGNVRRNPLGQDRILRAVVAWADLTDLLVPPDEDGPLAPKLLTPKGRGFATIQASDSAPVSVSLSGFVGSFMTRQ